MSLYQTAVNKPITTILIFVGFVVLGLYSLSKLAVDLYPKFEANTVTVMCSYPGASASDVETNVTRILENSLNTVDKLKKLTSVSKENFSVVTLEFEWGSEMDPAVNEVRDKLEMIKMQLPDGAQSPTIFKFSTNMIPVSFYSITAKESLPGLYKLLDEQVANPLNRIEGVASVSISGAPNREIQVNVDPRKIEAYGLTIEKIAQVIAAENQNTPAGSFDIGNNTYSLRVTGEFVDSRELRKVVVGVTQGRKIFLEEVAEINDTLQEKVQESWTNGGRSAQIAILKQSGANTVKIAQEIRKSMVEIQKTLPTDVKVELLMDTSDFIVGSINGLAETVMYAFFFVMLVVWIFLGRWRATFIIILTIPVSLIVSFIYILMSDGSINIITLSSLSIAIGMVVDDAIVVLENITTHIERGSPPKQAAVYATNEVGVAVIATTLTVVAVFLPLTMVPGIAGIMFKPLGFMVSIIILFSTLAALSLTPMLCSQMLRLNPNHNRFFNIVYAPIEKALTGLDNFYAATLQWAVNNRKYVLLGAFSIFGTSLFFLGNLETGFFPQNDNGRVFVDLKLNTGIRVEAARELGLKLTEEWREKYPEIEVVNFTCGIADDKNVFAVMSENGNHVISFVINCGSKTGRSRSIFDLQELMTKDLEQYPEIRQFTVSPGARKNQGMSMEGNFIDVEIYGYDFDVTNNIANQLVRKIQENVPGITDATVSREDFIPQYEIDFDRERLANFGFTTAQAGQFVRNRINGAIASKFREDGNEYDIRVRYDKPFRESIYDIEEILLYNASGQKTTVREVGNVVERFAPPSIERKNRQRMVKVQCDVNGALNVVGKQLQDQIDSIQMPPEVGIKLAGSLLDMQESFADLGTLLVLVILLVYIVMASQFESLSGPFIIMLSLPFAFTGVFLSLSIAGMPLDMMGFIGAIMLVGIVVKNGIVLVDFINLNRERGDSINVAVVSGGRSRLRPVLMTTLTTILGMVPMLLSNSDGAEMYKPMALVVIGGLTISTMLTLVVVPVVYTFFAAREEKKKLKKTALTA